MGRRVGTREELDDDMQLQKKPIGYTGAVRIMNSENGRGTYLNVAPPAAADVVKTDVSAQWLRSTIIGNFKSKVNPDTKKTYYPLFRLVALESDAVSNGLRAGLEDEMETPLPDAIPPWTTSDAEKTKEEERNQDLVRYLSSRGR